MFGLGVYALRLFKNSYGVIIGIDDKFKSFAFLVIMISNSFLSAQKYSNESS